MSQANIASSAGSAGRPPVAQSGEPDHIQQYLTFVLSGEVFAIGILVIKEIMEYANITAVPMTPAYVRGVINLRGAVVPVLDLSVRFGKPASEVTKRTCIVIIEVGTGKARQDIGIVVDAVHAVLDIPATDIEPAPRFGMHVHTDFVQGMGKVDGKFVILLDVNQVLAPEEAAALAQVSES